MQFATPEMRFPSLLWHLAHWLLLRLRTRHATAFSLAFSAVCKLRIVNCLLSAAKQMSDGVHLLIRNSCSKVLPCAGWKGDGQFCTMYAIIQHADFASKVHR